MISQETKDQIEKEIEKRAYLWGNDKREESFIIPIRLLRFAKYIAFDYADKLEEKDKIIESKDQEIADLKDKIIEHNANSASIGAADAEENWAKEKDDLLRDKAYWQLEAQAKYRELALKEIVEKMKIALNGGDRLNDNSKDVRQALTAYAEWCKQNLK